MKDVAAHDPDPIYACDVTKDGKILHWMAFDMRYGPENQAQIDWHLNNGTPGASRWEIGKPCKLR